MLFNFLWRFYCSSLTAFTREVWGDDVLIRTVGWMCRDPGLRFQSRRVIGFKSLIAWGEVNGEIEINGLID